MGGGRRIHGAGAAALCRRMSGFSAEWLALREVADRAARATDVTDAVLRTLPQQQSATIVDLGCGTGSNARYLAPHLPTSRWRLVDDDEHLLSVARTSLPYAVEIHVADLRELNEQVLQGCALVTASALLDLVSESWLARLVTMARASGSAVLMALNYDGRIACTPSDVDDELVRSLVNRHQQTDKGFGPALGPHAGVRAAALLRDAGYVVHRSPSDWVLGPEHAGLQRELIDGWASAAAETAPDRTEQIGAWRARRQAHVSAGTSHLIVGHDDVGAVLA